MSGQPREADEVADLDAHVTGVRVKDRKAWGGAQ